MTDLAGKTHTLPVSYNATSAAISISGENEAGLDFQKSILDTMTQSRVNAADIRQLQQTLGTFDIIPVEEMTRQALRDPSLIRQFGYTDPYATEIQAPYALYEINTMPGLIGGPPPVATGLLLTYYLTNSIQPECNYGKWEAHNENGKTLYRPEIMFTAKTPVGASETAMHIETRNISVKPEAAQKIGRVLECILDALEKNPNMTLADIYNMANTDGSVTLSKYSSHGKKQLTTKATFAGILVAAAFYTGTKLLHAIKE